MNPWFENVPNASNANDPVERELWRELSRPTPSPDLTRSIMGRLGYMKAAPGAVRRRRIRRWTNRLTLCLAALVAIGLAMRLHEASPNARQADGLTIPGAIETDLSRHEQNIRGTIQLIRELAPPPSTTPSPSPDALDEDVDSSGVGPFRWM
ncbi:MAG: hypothetical protein SYC29_18590 [Planctomycetota bacterium]|nr:hypothetical protein [Planctomycetota bacterium]